jgi:choline dehydrogenase-like flavoprotein
MTKFRNALTEAILRAGERMAWPIKEDVNEPDMGEGIGYIPRNIHRGKRQNAALAFLRPAMQRPNLTVITGATVDKVRFEGKRAVGIEFLKDGQRRQSDARREVILAAGAIASPAILERSGIGDPERLAALGIPLVQAIPQVGENASEHRAIRMQWRINRPLSLNLEYSGWRLVRSVLRYYLTGDGPMSGAAMDMRAQFRSDSALDRPDIYAVLGMFSWDLTGKSYLEKSHGFAAVVHPLRPVSKGTVHITSTDPAKLPAIEARYGSAPEDEALTVQAVRLMRRFAGQEPLAALVEIETAPGPDAQSDGEILAALHQFGNPCMHTVGTCRMGNDPDSVVDPKLRVRGVEGLRIMDASIMPIIPSGNTNGPTLAMAWRAAEIIQRDR